MMLKKMMAVMTAGFLSLGLAHAGMDEHMDGEAMMHDSDNHDEHMSHEAHDMKSEMGHEGHDMDHKRHEMKPEGHEKMVRDQDKMFLEKKAIDGYDVTFHIIKAKLGKEMGGSHDVMIKIEKDGKAITNAIMNTKVIHPNNKSESKMTMKMGDWYMAGYDLGHDGRHQIMILFKTADGAKHKGGVYYE